MTIRLPSVSLVAALVTTTCVPAATSSAEDRVNYLTQIKPLLETKCYACHGALKQEGGLRLETLSLMSEGGDSGAALVAKDAAGSLLLERVTADEDSRMPPSEEGAALKPDEIDLLRRWIEQGAVAPDEPIPVSPTAHWAFQRIERPAVETDKDTQNPIDALFGAKHAEHHLRPQPPAERSLLIRRLYLDLIGLPPSLEQLHDDRPYEQIVDELLASPHHGERWGRHWMDVWRYSDWYGLGAQLRYSQKHMWRWRDWIVNSLNADKGYDRMVQEMLAGDELDPTNLDVVAGTGFLARNYYLFNRTTWLDQTIEHTGKAFLGLTLNCAKCHDHKYDPLTHVDYYNFRAIFEPHQVRLDPVPGVTDFEKDGLPRVFDDHLDAETFLHKKGDPSNPDKDIPVAPQVPAILASFQPDIQPVDLPPTAYAPAVRDYVQRDLLKDATARITVAEKELAAAQKTLAELPKDTPAAKQPPAADFTFTDDFSQANPEAWDVIGDGWKYADDALNQTTATRDLEFVRFKQPLPRDFEVECCFTTTGGPTYKSVTFRFDQSDDGKYANYVYTSAHAPGPKVQVAYIRGGSQNYPGDAQAARPVKVGEPQVLKFAVRDNLVNVWWNGEFTLAYAFPDRQPEGRFTLSGFDATVAFDSIAIRSLPADVELQPAKNTVVPSPKDAATAVKTAEAKLKAAQAERKSLEAIFAADIARYSAHGSLTSSVAGEGGQPLGETDGVEQLAVTAARLQIEAQIAAAEHELLAAGSDTNKAKAAQTKLDNAKKQLESVNNGAASYTRLRASRKALETPAHKESDYPATYAVTSTGRRLALARWMTSRDNPLTARVAVNHVWMRHFGTPLVESVFDFGLRCEKPLHADVLDYLAVEFIESGYSFKHLHRLIVNSQAYLRSSSTLNAEESTVAADPTNRFYWRMNTRRMESQVVRDSLLLLSGALDPQLGGPSLPVSNGSNRRSLYFLHSRDDQDKFLTMFDDADLLQCYRRSESIVPQQALGLANSELSMNQASKIAARITATLPSADNADFVNAAFENLLGRTPTDEECSACLEFCDQLTLISPAGKDNTRVRLIHSLLNHNDFITIR
ncbi:MAG: PSD1 and planctomycete cytochrome C domain-containing protein [Planctomycetaceae bacterium]